MNSSRGKEIEIKKNLFFKKEIKILNGKSKSKRM